MLAQAQMGDGHRRRYKEPLKERIKVSKRLKSAFQGSVNGNCFPSLKIATFKLTMWGKRNHKYELLFRQQTASICSPSPLPLGIHMPQSS